MERIDFGGWYSEGKLAEILGCQEGDIANIFDVEPYLFTPGVTTKVLDLKEEGKIRFFSGKGILWVICRCRTKQADTLFNEIIDVVTKSGFDVFGFLDKGDTQ